jgi:hypothetical protein
MKKSIQLFCTLLLIIFTTQYTVFGQNIDYAKVEATINNLVAKNKFSGVVLIAEKGKIKYEKANGFIEYVNQTPLKNSTLFELASVSKQFTAMTIMMLHEKGKLQYDLNDGSIVAIYESTQEYLNNILKNKPEIVDYMRESKNNFMRIIKELEE